jgi:hypothetical protein
MDNIVLVQDVHHSNAYSKGKGMVVKLDMANTFDCVCHSFLFKVMEKFGFNSSFIKWAVACIGNPWIVPLVNGRPSNFFQVNQGLNQGFPLSPLLFPPVVETLSRKLEHERDLGNFPSLQITKGVKNMNLEFVDDTLLLKGCISHYCNKIQTNFGFFP